MSESPSSFVQIRNLYTPGMPLRPGNPTFYGREALFQAVRQRLDADTRRVLLVLIGQRRIGKTSVLLQLPAHLDPARYLCVFVDGNGLGIDPGIDSFYLSLMEDIVLGLERAGLSMPRIPRQALGESPERFFEHQFLREVRVLIGARTLLLTLDEFEELGVRVASGALPASVLSHMRHLIRHGEQMAFVFAGMRRIEGMSGDYWSALYDMSNYLRIGFLREDAARRLIVEPVRTGVQYDSPAVQEILCLTAGHPYLIQLLCHILVNRCNDDERNEVTVQNVGDALDELLDLSRAHLTYVWSTLDEGMRLCLSALADLLQRADQVPLSAIANRLEDLGLAMKPAKIDRIVTSLVARDLVAAKEGNPTTYSLTADLYAYWLCRYRPLSRLADR